MFRFAAAILVPFCVLAIPVGPSRADKAEDNALEWLYQRGGRAERSGDIPGGPVVSVWLPRPPRW